MEIDLSDENTKTIMDEYGSMLCDECRGALTTYGTAVTERLNDGKKPRMRDMQKLLNALCPVCYGAILRKKVGGMRQ